MEEMLNTMLKSFQNVPDTSKMGFFGEFFKRSPESYVNTDRVSYDSVNASVQIAPAVDSIGKGAPMIKDDVFTGHELPFPTFALSRAINMQDLMKRQPGETEYAGVESWWGRLGGVVYRSYSQIVRMHYFSMEKIAADVMQTGKIELKDEHGNKISQSILDFGFDEEHLPTVKTKWTAASANPIADIESLCDVIATTGYVDARNVIFGRQAWDAFIANEKVKELLNKDSYNLMTLNPRNVNRGGRFMGKLKTACGDLDLWVYNAVYTDYNTSEIKHYLDPKKVIVTADIDDLDFRAVFGGNPLMQMKEPFSEIIPTEVVMENGMRFHNRVFEAENCYKIEVVTRPLCIPVSKNRIGCMQVVA